MSTADERIPDEDEFLLQVLELVHPDQIDKLLAIARQEGRPIADIITEALWHYFKKTGGLPEHWPFCGRDDKHS
jgi:hypothetical protein